MAKKNKTDTEEPSMSNPGAANNTPEENESGSESSVSDQMSGMVDSAKQAGAHVLDQAKTQAASRADQQRQSLASGMQAVANAFQSMGKDLQTKDQGPVAAYAAEMGQAIAGQVGKFANHLQGTNVRELIGETEDFARRSPAVFLGGAFVLGLAASRFLKSSRPASTNARPQPTDFGPGSVGTQLALPPASTPSALPPPVTTGSSMPSGFPFDSREPSGTRPASGVRPTPWTPASTDPAGT